jgi:hypothetical protein
MTPAWATIPEPAIRSVEGRPHVGYRMVGLGIALEITMAKQLIAQTVFLMILMILMITFSKKNSEIWKEFEKTKEMGLISAF